MRKAKKMEAKENYQVEERTFKTMRSGGALSISFGVVNVVVGVVSGIILIVSGAKLLSAKRRIMF
ncbi:MAG: hypothetical protein MJ105_07555 [Lachnospiraceae bacterium]|nr:hypothetical protein [Lachnospiraceae bacterium]